MAIPMESNTLPKQIMFKHGENNQYFLVDIYESGTITLKVKDEGWSDIWSLPLEEVKGPK